MSDQLSIPGFEEPSDDDSPRGDLRYGLFLGLQPDPTASEQVEQLLLSFQHKHKIRGSRVRKELFHTSLFSVWEDWHPNPDDIENSFGEIRAKVSAAMASLTVVPFPVTFDHAMTFNHPDGPLLVLVGDKGVEELKRFYRRLGVALQGAGLGHVKVRPYTPHISLIYGQTEVPRIAIEPVTWLVREFVLIQSVLRFSRYRVQGKWTLGP